MLTNEERYILINVLIYHYRKDSQHCGCGWGELGKSHAEHVVDVFESSVRIMCPRKD